MSQDRSTHLKPTRVLHLANRGSLVALAALAIALPTVAQTDLGVFSIGAEHRLQGSVDPAVTAGNGFSGEYHDVASGNANFALSISRDFIAANDPTGTFTSPHIDHPFGPGDNEIGDQIMGVTTTIQNYLGDDFANYVGPNNDLPGSLFLYRGFLNVRPEFDLFGGNGTIDINFGVGNGEGFSFFLGGTEAGLFDGELVFENVPLERKGQ